MKNIKEIPWETISEKLRGDSDGYTDRILSEWLKSNEDNRRLFAELSALWDDIRSRASIVNPDKDKLWNELRERTIAKTRKRRLRQNGVVWAASAFVTASLLFGVVWFFQFRSEKTYEPGTQVIENISGKSRVVIPDGSQVWLHNNTRITYDGDFGRGSRNITLIGEAFLDVEYDPERPFTISVNGLDVKVLGTRFNVRSYPGSDLVTVGLLEGEVALSVGGGPQNIMAPGQTAVYDQVAGTITIGPGDVYFESLWKNDRLHINNRPLGEICRYLERWYNTSITVDPAAADAFSYSFTITNEPLEEVLRIMSRINPVSYRFMEDRGVVISRK